MFDGFQCLLVVFMVVFDGLGWCLGGVLWVFRP